MEFPVLLVRCFRYFPDGGVPQNSFTLELRTDSVDGDEILEECTAEGVVFKDFDVFALISWFTDEQPVDAVGGDTVVGVGCSVMEVFSEVFDCAFVVVEALAFAEDGLVGVADVEVNGAAVSFVVPFADVVQSDSFADRPDEVLVDELFRVLLEFLLTDFVFPAEEDGFDVCGGASGEFFREDFDCGSSHVVACFL